MEIFEVRNPNELLAGLEVKSDYILIKGEYSKKVKNLKGSHLSEDESLGVVLGGGGLISIFIYAFDLVRGLFSNEDKMEKKIDKKLSLYKVKKVTDDSLLLSLKQLDY